MLHNISINNLIASIHNVSLEGNSRTTDNYSLKYNTRLVHTTSITYDTSPTDIHKFSLLSNLMVVDDTQFSTMA